MGWQACRSGAWLAEVETEPRAVQEKLHETVSDRNQRRACGRNAYYEEIVS